MEVLHKLAFHPDFRSRAHYTFAFVGGKWWCFPGLAVGNHTTFDQTFSIYSLHHNNVMMIAGRFPGHYNCSTG